MPARTASAAAPASRLCANWAHQRTIDPMETCRAVPRIAAPEWVAKKLWRTLLVGAPCFSRGKLDFSPAEKKPILKWALAPAFSISGAKARDQKRTFSRSAEALFPPHKCGGSRQEEHVVRLLGSRLTREFAWRV